MKISSALLALPFLASSVFGQVATNQKTYTLAKEQSPLPVGRTFMVKKHMTMTDAKLGMNVAGQQVDGKMNMTENQDVIYEFLSADKVRLTYKVDAGVNETTMMGQAQKEEKVKAAQGKVFIAEKKDGEWTAKLEKGEIKEDEKKEIEKEIKSIIQNLKDDGDAKMYGTKPRKIGDSWKVDASVMPGMEELKNIEGEVTVSFLEVKEFQSNKCAVLKVSFDVKGDMDDEDLKGATMGFSGDGRVIRSLSLFRDLKFEGEGKMKMDGKVEIQPGVLADMVMVGPMKMSIHAAEKKAGK